MPNLPTPQMVSSANPRWELDYMRMLFEKAALRSGTRPEAEQSGQGTEHRADADEMQGVC
jgi:hypothetical protein